MASAPSAMATLNYSVATTSRPAIVADGPDCAERLVGIVNDPRRVTLQDGRAAAETLRLDKCGFLFLRLQTRMTDSRDKTQLRTIYEPEVEAMVKTHTGARRVIVFDPTLRDSSMVIDPTGPIRLPVMRVHADFNARAAQQTLRDLLPNESNTLLKRRFSILQIWRPISCVVESLPLAVADARTVPDKDLLSVARVYPSWEGETCFATYRSSHHWYWFPRMTSEEIVLFKVYDSASDGRARWVIHSAFALDGGVAATRESIEIRALAIF